MQGAGRLPSQRLLDHDGLNARQVGRCLLDSGAIARDQRRPNANGARQRRVERGLALLAAIDSQRIDRAPTIGVIHDGPLGANRGVVANEEGDLEGGIEAGPHRERLIPAADQFHAIIEFVEQEVAHVTVRIVDEEAGRPRAPRTGDGGVRLSGHQPAGALVLRHATHHLVKMDDPRHAFHVDGQKDPVAFRWSRCRVCGQRLGACVYPAFIMFKSRSRPAASLPRDASIPSCSDSPKLINRPA